MFAASLYIGLLATGEEIIEGDILNLNGQHIARQLTESGLEVGFHIISSDKQKNIEKALLFLHNNHDAIIITGGLGATSDDNTRFALSAFTNKELQCDKLSWDAIQAHFQTLNMDIPTSNRQQALFPPGADIFPNFIGTAPGCKILYQGKPIYMLPGPPRECLPMFQTYVLTDLCKLNPGLVSRQCFKWLLLGASEGAIAEKIEKVTAQYKFIKTGYRAIPPYVEVKIYTNKNENLNELLKSIQALVSPYLISDVANKTAVDCLQEYVCTLEHRLVILDNATQGMLQAQLVTPKTLPFIKFVDKLPPSKKTLTYIIINGLEELWQEKRSNISETKLRLIMNSTQQGKKTKKLILPFYHLLTRKYATEFSAKTILNFLRHEDNLAKSSDRN